MVQSTVDKADTQGSQDAQRTSPEGFAWDAFRFMLSGLTMSYDREVCNQRSRKRGEKWFLLQPSLHQMMHMLHRSGLRYKVV